MIEIRDLTITYPGASRPAVDRLTLEIGAGEVFGFIGPNGAGKTSTLKMLAGLQSPASGLARVAGVDVAADPAGVRRRVGYLPDFFGVYDDLTCREYLAFFAAAQGLASARRDAVVDEVLALVELTQKAEDLAGSLSRGMQQRLGLARVLVHEPEVLLLDEPASGLDPRARIEVREVLRELGSMGKTVILSSHVLSDLASVCTSVGIIEQGRLAYAGTVREAARRAAGAHATLLVGCLEGAEAAESALRADEGLASALAGARWEPADGLLRLIVPAGAAAEGTDAATALAAHVGASLHRAGLHVTHLQVEHADLEKAFMALTAGELA